MTPQKRTFQFWIPHYITSLRSKGRQKSTLQEITIKAYEGNLKLFARYKTYLAKHGGDTPETTGLLAGLGMSVDVDADAYEISDFLTKLRTETFHHDGRPRSKSTVDQFESILNSFYQYLTAQNVIDANPMNRIEQPEIKDHKLKYLQHKEVMAFIASPELLISFDEQIIHVRGKGGKIRIVLCDRDTLPMIQEHLHGDGQIKGPVFLGNAKIYIND